MLAALPPWARGVVLAAGCAALVLGVAILAWLVRPGCFAALCCRRRRRDPAGLKFYKDATPSLGKPKFSVDEELQLENVTYHSWARGSLYDTTTVSGEGNGDGASRASHRDSTYSSMSEGTDTSSVLSCASGVLPEDPAHPLSNSDVLVGPPGPPTAVLLVQYIGQEGASSSMGRLAVTVVGARCLPPRDYGSSPDPAVQLSIAPLRRLFHFHLPALLRPHSAAPAAPAPHTRPLHLVRTRTVRHSRQPHYNEDFAVEARKADLKDWVLQVSVLDDCKLRGSSVLCRGEVRLKQTAQAAQASPGEPTQLRVAMAPCPEERALMLFGLSFLPTAQRLNVSLIKATRVRLEHVVASPASFRPFVRATLVHAGSGRRVETARTEPHEPSASPEFCETLSLRLTPSQLGTLSLVVSLCHRLPESDERAPGRRRPRDRVVGAVAIGSRVTSQRGREHWRSIEQRPRRVVSVWHTLT